MFEDDRERRFEEIFSRILKILLRDLIEKTIQQDRNNSKILLRSNASIAEKMLSNWFAFLLFGYIKVCPSCMKFFSSFLRLIKGTSWFSIVYTVSIYQTTNSKRSH